MSVTYYSSNRLIDYNFGATAYSGGLPGTYYFGLSTSTINIDGTGATEPSGNGYVRMPFTNNKTNWGNASLGILKNAVEIVFPESTGSWGTITYVAMWDALTLGNIWWYDVLTPSRDVPALTTIIFAVNGITVTFNNT
jgi:hypothetical protein